MLVSFSDKLFLGGFTRAIINSNNYKLPRSFPINNMSLFSLNSQEKNIHFFPLIGSNLNQVLHPGVWGQSGKVTNIPELVMEVNLNYT